MGVQPRDEAGEARFSTVVHWSYGTSWGAVRGLLHAAGCGVHIAGVRRAAAKLFVSQTVADHLLSVWPPTACDGCPVATRSSGPPPRAGYLGRLPVSKGDHDRSGGAQTR
ncbi:MAG: hypothetical protein LC790_09670 [Actinobacteria bacterium]|nr:hypothetical protein [Actinomycetota bacterium]